MENIIGRHREIKILEKVWNSREAEFIAIYGRRRVGKTYLVREFFAGRELYFEVTGIKDGTLHEQLENFVQAFSAMFYPGIPIRKPDSWRNAFELLTHEIQRLPQSQKITVFFDEVPWMATKRSGFLQNLDYFWNTHGTRFLNLKLIVCGSAASWVLDNLINAKGGLHNRLTQTILLEPFNLSETKEFLRSRGIRLNDRQILDIYMVMGGIPHYLKQIQKGKSAVPNIDEICFQKDGLLYTEFPRLFRSLFDASQVKLKIAREIALHRNGISREELLKKTEMKSGGSFNKHITELESAGFIRGFIPYGRRKKDYYFRLIDEYSLFYLTWIEPIVEKGCDGGIDGYWQTKFNSPSWQSWAGYAFEGICYKYANNIRKALGLEKVACEIGTWSYIPKKGEQDHGCQIDLLFDREDGTVSLCEIKYSSYQFCIDKSYARNLINKLNVFEKYLPCSKQLFLVMVTTQGLKKNIWSEDLIQNVVTLKDLFST